MEWIVCETQTDAARAAAEPFIRLVKEKPACVLGFATGSTPLALYGALAEQCRNGLDFSRVTTFNLDEYYPMPPSDPQSYRYYMERNLFSRINIAPENTFLPDGKAADPNAAARRYEDEIARRGGVDLQLLGVGRNGHIGFNEPADALIDPTHMTDLTESTRLANARFFESVDQVPKQAMTMGMGTILRAKAIVCLITGADKHAVVRAMQDDRITPACPATFLKLHPRVTVVCDREAMDA